jgi:hypothetical protein
VLMHEQPAGGAPMKWKRRLRTQLTIGFGLMALTSAGFLLIFPLADTWLLSLGDERAGTLMLGVLAVGVAGFVYLWGGIRCPACGFRLFAHAARYAPAGTTLRSVLSMDACVRCNHRFPSD